jgi:hypothetical protein
VDGALGGVEGRDVDLARREAHAVGTLDLDAVVAEADREPVGDEADRDAIDQHAGAEQIFADDLNVAARAGV